MELHERDVRTEVGKLHLRISGGGTNPTLLFWPSLLMDGRMWLRQAEHFAADYQVVLVDPPGHGLSARLSAPFEFDSCARAVTQVLDDLGIDRTHFVGCSWGAMTGITLAARHPERTGAVILMNGTASPAGRRQRREFGSILTAARVTGRRAHLAAAVDAFLGPTTRRARPEVTTMVRSSIDSLDLRSVVYAMRSVVVHRPDQTELLATITAPVLVAGGDEDPVFSVAETKAVADGIADAKLMVLPKAGHLLPLEVPAQVNSLIEEFLASYG